LHIIRSIEHDRTGPGDDLHALDAAGKLDPLLGRA
jgi:hypothetical protein